MQVARDHLVDVLAVEVGLVDLSQLVAGQVQNSQVAELTRDLEELVPRVQEVLVEVQVHAVRDQAANRAWRAQV